MRVNNKNTHVHRKRHGVHQKRTRHFLKVYTPYLPLSLFVALSFIFSSIPIANKPKVSTNDKSVLAYATEISISGLLSSTNQERTNVGAATLAVNSKLNSAAQAKVNDMINKNYWSHNTPDGQEPWVFITNAGYSYSRAGENLAYGYSTSAKTVAGWMNSPAHRDNLLNTYYQEVGFGIANGANYVGDPKEGPPGPQTVVVAMYATPYTSAPSSAKKAAPKATPKATAPAPAAPTPTPAAQPEEKKESSPVVSSTEDQKPPTTATVASDSKSINRLDLVTKASLPWLGSLLLVLSAVGGLIVLTRHGLAFQRFVLQGERYVLKHTLFDMTIISMIIFSYIATRTVGIIL